jgi:uncharacterized protein (DUF2141 family)
MRTLRYLFLLIPGLLLWACAQVGTLSGGDKDVTAPQIKNANPPNGQTEFKNNQIELSFDEFIVLNNPSQTVQSIPKIKTLNLTSKKNKVILSWTDTLQSETTYQIQLNRTVKDYVQGNDSVMQIVFSTGKIIDTLRYETKVIHAFYAKPMKNIVVGLFPNDTSKVPSYFGLSNETGDIKLSYIKAGTYYVKAFDDLNKDMQYQSNESLAYKENPVTISSHLKDTIPLRMSKVNPLPKITSFEFAQGESFLIGANFHLVEGKFYLNDTLVTDQEIQYINTDSLRIFKSPMHTGDFTLKYVKDTFQQVLNNRIIEKQLKKPLTINLLEGKRSFRPKDPIVINFPFLIDVIDTSKIEIFNAKDSAKIKYTYLVNRNYLELFLERSTYDKIELKFGAKALCSKSGLCSKALNFNLEILQLNDLGDLNIDLSLLPKPGILDFINEKGEAVESYSISSKDSILGIKQLFPGTYTFRYIIDENTNGLWDPIQLKPLRQPEKVLHFTDKNVVRANWEINLKLRP